MAKLNYVLFLVGVLVGVLLGNMIFRPCDWYSKTDEQVLKEFDEYIDLIVAKEGNIKLSELKVLASNNKHRLGVMYNQYVPQICNKSARTF